MSGTKYKLTRYEMETVINFNAAEDTATIYTRDKSVMRKIDHLVKSFPDAYKELDRSDIDRTYQAPKKLFTIRAPRTITEEQRKAIAERLAKSRRKESEQ